MSTPNPNFLDTIVGELVLLDGQRQSDAPHILALSPPRRAHADRRHETLFVFLDLGGGGSSGLAQAMLEHFTRAYWHHPGTATTVLRQAIGAANTHMLEENRLLPVNKRRQGGIVCAVLRDNNLYLAQIGPAEVLLAQGGRVIRFPSEPRDVLPLGMSSSLDIHFTHCYIQGGDMFLLTGESWTDGLPQGALLAALASEGEDAEKAMLALESQSGTGSVSVLVVQCVSGEYAPAPTSLTEPTEQPAPLRDTGAIRRFTRDAEAVRSSPLRDVDTVPHTDDIGARSEALGGAERLEQVRRGLRQAGLVLGDGARTLFTRVLPEPEPLPPRHRRRVGRARAENVPTMAGIAVAIPLLVAFVVVTFYLQRSTSARREGLAGRAEEAVQAAREASAEDARARWDAALQAVQYASSASPDDNELAAMHSEVLAQLDALDGVLRPELTLLWDYGAGEGHRLAATRLQIYVLDADRHQVTQYTLDQARQGTSGDPPNLIAYRGESVGDGEVGELRDIVWLEAGGDWVSDGLLILTQGNQLLRYSLSWGLSWVPMDTGLAHVDARLLNPYQGRLYVLDSEQSQIWRFPPSGEGFGPPEGYFPAAAPDLSSAIDVAIDGAVYILTDPDQDVGGGNIYKFMSGEAQVFQLSGLPRSLIRPVALASEGDAVSGALYVADAGAQSIVALTKNGEFIHQLKAPIDGDVLAGLEALAIEERNRILYVMAGGRLYAMALPPVPEPPDTSD